jgi:hypothetical protein
MSEHVKMWNYWGNIPHFSVKCLKVGRWYSKYSQYQKYCCYCGDFIDIDSLKGYNKALHKDATGILTI